MTTYDKNKNTIQKPNEKNTISKIGTFPKNVNIKK
jgi:hypothetical protein